MLNNRGGMNVALAALVMGGILLAGVPAGASEAETRVREAEQAFEEAMEREAELTRERDDALARLEDLREASADAAEQVDDAEEELSGLETEIAALETSVERLLEAIDDREEQVAHLVRDLYKGGGAATYEAMLNSDAVLDTIRRFGYLQGAQRSQSEILDGFAADRDVLEVERGELEEARKAQVALTAELRVHEAALQEQVAEQETEEEELQGVLADLEEEKEQLRHALAEASEALEAEQAAARAAEGDAADSTASEARSASATPASTSGGVACPVGEPREFSDTYGAARSGGRSHMGTDILAPRGTPIYAYEDGEISRMSSNRLGGISLYLRGDSGNQYYYTHLAGYIGGLSSGQRVSAGEQIAYNGDTGNARGIPHLHIEVRAGGGSNVNPYPYMRRACG